MFISSACIVLFLRISLVICLYLFLGMLVHSIWRTHISQKISDDRTHQKVCLLLPDQPQSKPACFFNLSITIGKNNRCEFILKEDSVDNYHSQIYFGNNRWWIEDLQSSCGTYLNNRRITVPHTIKSGNKIRCGVINIIFIINNDFHY